MLPVVFALFQVRHECVGDFVIGLGAAALTHAAQPPPARSVFGLLGGLLGGLLDVLVHRGESDAWESTHGGHVSKGVRLRGHPEKILDNRIHDLQSKINNREMGALV